ncbi:hypothetical protein D0469_07125 [Peribacillus saganii]|uniref:Uncharacterized protein n=1 Tax=Peribacillus saganii TaxID=2303992 RepID=A0A372LQN6_9BACI|nr:hypothetical protein [Peribacillus saganii]RFU70366.1 hypothetical protein D0469_07125 [Peribacillus saganii]
MEIRIENNESGSTDVIVNAEGVDYQIGIIEEHPTAPGYFRAIAYDGSLLQSSEQNLIFYDVEQAKNAIMQVYAGIQ